MIFHGIEPRHEAHEMLIVADAPFAPQLRTCGGVRPEIVETDAIRYDNACGVGIPSRDVINAARVRIADDQIREARKHRTQPEFHSCEPVIPFEIHVGRPYAPDDAGTAGRPQQYKKNIG